MVMQFVSPGQLVAMATSNCIKAMTDLAFKSCSLVKLEMMQTIFKNPVRTSQEILRLHYRAQPVNAVWGNSRCLL
jgi:hypothetical protein